MEEDIDIKMILRRKIFYSVLFSLLPIVALMQGITLLRIFVTLISSIIVGYNIITFRDELKQLRKIKEKKIITKEYDKEDKIKVKVIDNTLKRNEKQKDKVKKIGALKR